MHRQGDLAEIVARSQYALSAAAPLADREHPVEDDVEAVAGLSLRDDARARRDLFPCHVLCKAGKRLAGKRREQPDP